MQSSMGSRAAMCYCCCSAASAASYRAIAPGSPQLQEMPPRSISSSVDLLATSNADVNLRGTGEDEPPMLLAGV